MSSTNRGTSREARDFYPTPAWCVRRLLDAIGDDLFLRFGSNATLLEPCVGTGVIVEAVFEWYFRRYCARPPLRWQLIDIEPKLPASFDLDVVTGDYLEASFAEQADIAITNPPFSRGEEFLNAMRQDAKVVCVLQRLNWLGSEARAPFWQTNMPDIYVLPNRPSFKEVIVVNGKTKTGATDSSEYAWFVWGLTHGGHIKMLGVTSPEERGVKPKTKKEG